MDSLSQDKLLLTSREAASQLSISERSLWSLTQSKQIPSVRIGRSVRYSLAALKQWIEQRNSGQAA